MAVQAHRLANYAQEYESFRSLVSMMDAHALLASPKEFDENLEESLAKAEAQFYEGLQSYNEGLGGEPQEPVLINGIIYQALEGYIGHVIRIDPSRPTDIVTQKMLTLVLLE